MLVKGNFRINRPGLFLASLLFLFFCWLWGNLFFSGKQKQLMDLRPLFLGCRHSLLSPALATSHKFCCVVVSYHSKYFFISPLVSSLTHTIISFLKHISCISFLFPWWLCGKESTCQSRKHRLNPRVRKIPWRRKGQPTPVFLPGKSHGQRSLVGYSPWGHKSQTWRLNNNKFHF